MIETMSAANVAAADRFVRLDAAADAIGAAQARDAFARWLGTFFDLDPNRTNDLVLALNEAVANSAEHAYSLPKRPGTMDVEATYDSVESMLTVTVCDRGRWRMSDPTPANRSRGRGISLMTALADRADIESSADGTLVRLSWGDVHRR